MSARFRGGEAASRLRGRLKLPAGWLPGALTLGNVLAGYSAILMAAQGRFLIACILIYAAAFLDFFDGRVARMTGTTSDFGEQLDSLADAVSFGVAPSMLAFHMGLHSLGRIGWGVCFLFAACGVIRLARFNALTGDSHDFIGVPIPTAAAVVACPALLLKGEPSPEWFIELHAVIVIGAGLLMVSRIRYLSPKNLRFGPKPYRALACWAAILAGLVMKHEWVVPGLLVLYLVSPIWFLIRRRFRSSSKDEEGGEGGDESLPAADGGTEPR